MPTHAPLLLVTHLGSVSTFLSYHARGSPLGVALSWVVSVPGFPSGGVGTSRVRLLPTSARTMALKPPFSSLCYCSGLHLNLATLSPGDALLLATPSLGDALSWRCLARATPCLSDAFSGQSVDFSSLGPSSGPTIC